MIDSIKLVGYGPIKNLEWQGLKSINLIIGQNATGKTITQKALFSALKCLEEVNKGDDNRSVSEIISEKMYWTFQTNGSGLGTLVNTGSEKHLLFEMTEGAERFSYEFGVDTKKKVMNVQNSFTTPREKHTIFIPAREILSLYQVILKSRETDRVFGYDDTEYGLVKAMQYPARYDEMETDIVKVAEELRRFDSGTLEYDKAEDKWVFRGDNGKIPIGLLSDGIRKMAVIEKLLLNNYIQPGSVVIIDEIESSLHPEALVSFIDAIFRLSQCGIQFFISTHSYITIKKMYVMAHEKNISIPTVSFSKEKNVEYSDLLENVPDNDIIKAAREIYEKEIDVIVGGIDD